MLAIDIAVQRKDFTLEARLTLPGAIVGVFGRSGSGKSTLLHCISGLVRPDTGSITLDGQPLFDRARRVWVPPHRRGVGMVFQDGRLFPHLTVGGNLGYARPAAGTTAHAFAAVVEMLELGPLLARRPASLSGGERQRVALGRALLAAPRLLLLDEPMAALDRGLKRQILPFLRRVRERAGIPVLHVSHDLGELLALTDRLILLDHGRVAGHGTILELAGEPSTLDLLHDIGLAAPIPVEVACPGGPEAAELRAGALVLYGPPYLGPAGARTIAQLKPEDVILAGAPVPGLSVRNQLRGTVTRVVTTPRRCLVVLDVGVPVLADVVPEAVRDLGIAPGRQVWVLFKATALRYQE